MKGRAALTLLATILIISGIASFCFALYLPHLFAVQPQPQSTIIDGMLVTLTRDKAFYYRGDSILWKSTGWLYSSKIYVVNVILRDATAGGQIRGGNYGIPCQPSCEGSIPIKESFPFGTYYLELSCNSVIPSGSCFTETVLSSFFGIQEEASTATTTQLTQTTGELTRVVTSTMTTTVSGTPTTITTTASSTLTTPTTPSPVTSNMLLAQVALGIFGVVQMLAGAVSLRPR